MNDNIKVEINEAVDGEISFQKRSKIYQAKVKGTFRTLKNISSYVLLAVFFALPFMRYERAGDLTDQAVMVDLVTRKFFFFAIEVWPQEAYYFIGLMIFAALMLFFATSLLGRVWCGYACPQTVFSDIFYRIEEFVEGSYQKRIRQDKKIFNLKVLPKKVIKHSLWLALSFATGATVTFYFADAYDTTAAILTGQASFTVYFWTLFLTATTYVFAGFAREYICIYACPYSRFQGAMMDADSLVVAYDEVRGEPRGKSKDDNAGDCVDCNRCVVACPVGIDIRDGQQYQCINCGLCVDACNDIMAKLEKPLNLIRYDTLRNLQLEAKGEKPNYRILRPRTIIYGTILLVLGSLLLFGLLYKKQILEVSIQASRSPLYVQLANGDIRNIYEMKIINKSYEIDSVNLKIEGLEKAKVTIKPKYKVTMLDDDTMQVKLKHNKINNFKVFVDSAKYEKKNHYQDLDFIVKAGEIIETYSSKFTHPNK